MHVVQNAVDLNRIDQITKDIQVSHKDQFTITSVGLIKIKNPFTVFEAFRQLNDPQSKLVIIGEGTLKPFLAQEVEKFDLQKQVQLTGMIPRDKVFENFTQADLFVSASWGEGLPVAVMEAMACRRPVLLSDIPPHREITKNIDFIPLLRPDDAAGYAREIKRYKEMPASERTRIGQECRRLIEERFSLDAMHAGYADVYAQITG